MLKDVKIFYNMPKLCEFENCKNIVTYGFISTLIRCIMHKAFVWLM